jgi:hypothetical protein
LIEATHGWPLFSGWLKSTGIAVIPSSGASFYPELTAVAGSRIVSLAQCLVDKAATEQGEGWEWR